MRFMTLMPPMKSEIAAILPSIMEIIEKKLLAGWEICEP